MASTVGVGAVAGIVEATEVDSEEGLLDTAPIAGVDGTCFPFPCEYFEPQRVCSQGAGSWHILIYGHIPFHLDSTCAIVFLPCSKQYSCFRTIASPALCASIAELVCIHFRTALMV